MQASLRFCSCQSYRFRFARTKAILLHVQCTLTLNSDGREMFVVSTISLVLSITLVITPKFTVNWSSSFPCSMFMVRLLITSWAFSMLMFTWMEWEATGLSLYGWKLREFKKLTMPIPWMLLVTSVKHMVSTGASQSCWAPLQNRVAFCSMLSPPNVQGNITEKPPGVSVQLYSPRLLEVMLKLQNPFTAWGKIIILSSQLYIKYDQVQMYL